MLRSLFALVVVCHVCVAEPHGPAKHPLDEPVSDQTIQTLKASTLRVVAKDSKGTNFGTAVIIKNTEQGALALTCAHLFKHGATEISVESFENGIPTKHTGSLLRQDREADLALIQLKDSGELPSVSVAPRDYVVRIRQNVCSIGGPNALVPTRDSVQAIDKFVGPHNIVCGKQPEVGRSGGPLFDGRGALIGICIAADPSNETGVYTGSRAIADFLKGTSAAK